MTGYWPEDWRARLAAAFDEERDATPEIRIVLVGEGLRYTGVVGCCTRDGVRWQHDAKLAGQRATG